MLVWISPELVRSAGSISVVVWTVRGLGPDDPRPVQQERGFLHQAGRFTPGGQTIPCMCTGLATFANGTWISPPRRDPIRKERYTRVCLRIGMSSKTPLDDVESQRGED
jgi:hypothetical protein